MTETTITLPKLVTKDTAKTFHFYPDRFVYEDTGENNRQVILLAKDITAMRFEVKWIRGRYIVIGRHFKIELKTWKFEELKISFSSYYSIRKKSYTDIYQKLVQNLFAFYLKGIMETMLKELKQGDRLVFDDLVLNLSGVTWDKYYLTWNEVALKKYRHYFAIYDKHNPVTYKALKYATDWNAVVAREIIEKMITE